MSYRLINNIRDELEKIADKGLTAGNLDTAYKLVDMLKDMENIEYWKCKEDHFTENSYGYERESSGNSRRSDHEYSNANSGKHYVRGHYSREGERDTYSNYMDNKNSYRSAKSVDEKQNMLAALEEHLSVLSDELEGMSRDADCKEERAAISRFIQKLKEMI